MPEANDISFLVCNEFFDALPIHQFEFDEKSGRWLEVLVDLDPSLGEEDVLRFVLSPGQTPAGRALIPMFEEKDLEGKKRIEVSPATLYHSQRISERILTKGGSALIIDYGHEGEKEDTFRAFKNHQLTDALKDVGESDLTADVNFSHIRAVAQSMGLDATHSVSQATFLKNMGIETRLLMLLRSTKDSAERKNLTSCYDFLVDKMGNRFRAMALTHPARKQSGQEVPGFYEIQQDFSAFMRAPPSVEFDIEDKK